MLVIINCGDGYHAVLSGLGMVAVAPGQTVQSGERIGAMRPAIQVAQAGDAVIGIGIEPPTLSLELRKQGRPVNPSPWLRPPG
jgi:septal ring factor EnvC (AmiA/AmiB activator)